MKWKEYPEDECTWEPGEHLTHADDEIETFHRQNPNAPTIELSEEIRKGWLVERKAWRQVVDPEGWAKT